MKKSALAVLVFSALAFAGTGPTPAPSVPVTRAAQTFYVSGTGSDANPCTQALPCRQIKTAIDKFRPLRIRHLQKIEVGNGSFQGFSLQGLVFDPLDDGTPCCVHIYGLPSNATVATGTATGTLTAATAATISTATYGTVTDSSQIWTVDDLRGKALEILTGTSAGQWLPIISNTATTITIPTSGTIGAAGSTYAIRDLNALIDTPMLTAPSLAGATGTPAQGLPRNAGIHISQIAGVTGFTNLRIEMLKIAMPAATSLFNDVFVENSVSLVRMERMMLKSPLGTALVVSGQSQLSFNFNVIDHGTTASVVITLGLQSAGQTAPILNFSSSYVRQLGTGSLAMVIGGNGTGMALSNTQFDVDVLMSITGPNWLQMSGIVAKKITVNQNFGVRTRYASNGPGGSYVHLLGGSALEVSNCSLSNAIWIEGGGNNWIFDGTLLGTNNLIALSVGLGARVRLSSTSTITGTTEISLDGVSSTIASMRAASPKLVTNTYGSIVFE